MRCSCSCSLWDRPTLSCSTNALIWVTWLLVEDQSPLSCDDTSFFSCVLPSSSLLSSLGFLLSSSSLRGASPRSLFVLFVRMIPLEPLISYCTRWLLYLSRFGFLIVIILAICQVCCLVADNLHIDFPSLFLFLTISTPKILIAKTPLTSSASLSVPLCWRLFCGAIEYWSLSMFPRFFFFPRWWWASFDSCWEVLHSAPFWSIVRSNDQHWCFFPPFPTLLLWRSNKDSNKEMFNQVSDVIIKNVNSNFLWLLLIEMFSRHFNRFCLAFIKAKKPKDTTELSISNIDECRALLGMSTCEKG